MGYTLGGVQEIHSLSSFEPIIRTPKLIWRMWLSIAKILRIYKSRTSHTEQIVRLVVNGYKKVHHLEEVQFWSLQDYMLSFLFIAQHHTVYQLQHASVWKPLQGQTRKSNTQASEQSVKQLLYNSKEVVDNNFQAKQQARKRRNQGVERAQKGGWKRSVQF